MLIRSVAQTLREPTEVDSRATPTPATMPSSIQDATSSLAQATSGALSSITAATAEAQSALTPALQVKLLTPSAKAPTRGSAFAAGYDLYASESTKVLSRGQATVSTGISIAVPPGTYGRVAPRSGLAAKHGIDTGAGVVDADYRGEVKVILFNFKDTDFEIKEGDRIAQLILERIVNPEVQVVQELKESVRGAGGFGSTGGFGAPAAP